LSIRTADAGYELPVGLLDIAALASELDASVADLNVTIVMEKVSEDMASRIADAAMKAGVQLLGSAIDFSIRAAANGQSKEISDFGNTYVSRTMFIAGTID